MLIRWHGHACFEISSGRVIVTDPHDGKSIGIRTPRARADLVLVSHHHFDHDKVRVVEKQGTKVFDKPGEYELEEIKVQGIGSYHDTSRGQIRGGNTIFKFILEEFTTVHLGDLGHVLEEEQKADLRDIDVLFIPVGGRYTLDAKEAWEVVEQLNPRVIIPMHYHIGGLSLYIDKKDDFLDMAPQGMEVLRVGNEMHIDRDEMSEDQEIWVFSL